MAIAELFQGLRPVADAPATARQGDTGPSAPGKRPGPDGGAGGGDNVAEAGPVARGPDGAAAPDGGAGGGDGVEAGPVARGSHTPAAAPDNAPAQAHAGPAAAGDDGDWEERAAIVEHDGGAPREWAEGLATLEASGPPAQFTPAEWRQLVHDAGVFLDDWGRQASALGWTVYDIFGCHSRAPRARRDALGLVALLRGGRVVALTANAARIQHATGNVLTYRRRTGGNEARDGLLWDV